MAPPLQPVRGTRDIIGDDSARHHHVVETARKITSLYGFSEWQTPIFEDTRVFSRTLGETSDVVTKEMYTFDDRGGDSITLRPEGTAGVCRALITNGLTQTLPQKAFYQGPMFRYERPQKGRYRQFHQIGIELLGAYNQVADAEVIACGWHILKALGIAKDVVLNINTLGDTASRDHYRAALVEYLREHTSSLSPESQIRLQKNPLRILDSKDPEDQKLLANAPQINDHLSSDARAWYEGVKVALRKFGVEFLENPKIVRGLDYYNHTAFEFVTTSLGAQGTVLAGGRYDGLVAQMGGHSVPGVGWAAGVERLAMLLPSPPSTPAPIVVIQNPDMSGPVEAITAASYLRDQGIKTEIAYQPSVKGGLQYANRLKAKWAILANPGGLILKNLDNGSQSEVTLDSLATALKK